MSLSRSLAFFGRQIFFEGRIYVMVPEPINWKMAEPAGEEYARQATHTNAELKRRQELLLHAHDEMLHETEAQAHL